MNENETNNTNNKQHSEEDETMDATIIRNEYRRLDFSKLNFSEKVVTSNEALRDVIPINWSDDVLQGKKQVVIKKTEDK